MFLSAILLLLLPNTNGVNDNDDGDDHVSPETERDDTFAVIPAILARVAVFVLV